MKAACSALLAVILLAVAGAQAIAAEADVSPLALSKGAQALQFQVGYNFNLSAFEGGTLSYERFLRDRFSLRLGIGANTDYENGHRTIQVEGDRQGRLGVDMDNWHNQYSLSCQLISYRKGTVALYYGAGPRITYTNDQWQDGSIFVRNDGAIEAFYSTSWFRSFGVGMGATLGVQWLVSERFRFHAEYGTAVMYASTEDKRMNGRTGYENFLETVIEKADRFQIQPGGAKLGLSVTF